MPATAVGTADAHEEGARRALLERLAAGLSVITEPHRYQWTCCWLSYAGPHREPWLWQMCSGQMPGRLPEDQNGRHVTCGHWHHRAEVFMAAG